MYSELGALSEKLHELGADSIEVLESIPTQDLGRLKGEKMTELPTSEQIGTNIESYFGFRETPFGVTPDPRFFYSSPVYLEGLAAVVHGIKGKRGLILLTGEVGTGKTILLRKLMRQLEATVRFVFISNSHLTSYGLFEAIVQDLGVADKEKNRFEMIQELKGYLTEQLKRGQTAALLIDEAQNLSDEALEGLCGLSNLETEEEKLLQIVLVGQPELAVKLNKPGLRRVKQRIALHHRLYSLQTMGEVEDYIRHRVQVAGYDGPEIFNREAIEIIWYYSAGTPRLINIICDNALAMACQASKKNISAYMVMKAAGALMLERGPEAPRVGVPETVAPREKAPEARINHKRTAASDIESGGRVEGPAISVRGTEQVAMARMGAQGATVSPQILDYITRAATKAMGPMAYLVIRDQIFALGESRDAFPKTKLRELIELVSREILNETMRARFQNTMLQEIDALKTLRVS
jgi:general secretion pathway protein A